VLGLWLIVAAVGVVATGPLGDRVTAEFRGSDRIESSRVLHRLEETSPTGGDIAVVIDGITLDGGPAPEEVSAALTRVARIPGVVSVADPWSTGIPDLAATDDQAALVVVSYANGLAPEAERELAEAVSELAHGLEGTATGAGVVEEVLVGGEPIVLRELESQAEEDLLQGEAIALPIALVAMVFIFGGLRAAGMPLAVAAAGYLTAGIALLGATFVLDSVSVFALNVVSMLGLGLGIDYGLLLVFADPTMTSFGVGGLSAVLFSMVAALTLLPALLGILGARIKPAPVRADGSGAFYRLSRLVQRFALPVLIVVGSGLALLATPFLEANLENGDARSLPRSSEARAAALTLAHRFPSRGADPIVVIADVESGSAAAEAWIATLSELEGVAGLQVRDGFPAGTTVVDVVPAGTSQGEVAMELVHAIRDQATAGPFTAEVGGTAASTLDAREMIGSRVPWRWRWWWTPPSSARSWCRPR
jgi:RND superfamily putative drug exporter